MENTSFTNDNTLKEQKRKIFKKLNDFKNSAGIYSPQMKADRSVSSQKDVEKVYGPSFATRANAYERNIGSHVNNFIDHLGDPGFGFNARENGYNQHSRFHDSSLRSDSDYNGIPFQTTATVGEVKTSNNVRGENDSDSESDGMKTHDVYRRGGDHHEGIAGPVHTYQKTNKHAHFKWGVKHHVGHQYA
uniref:Uncharacterized protein n=1 Tax=Cacopsylla melanoneura TaxID=428564 RepID=A0A8D8T9Z8_9HEMI